MAVLGRLRSRFTKDGLTDVQIPFPPGSANSPEQAQQFVLTLNDLAAASGGRITQVPNSFEQNIIASFPSKEAAKDFTREASRVG